METVLPDNCRYPCSITKQGIFGFSIGGGKRGGFSENVLEHMPPGSVYEMFFFPSTAEIVFYPNAATLIIQRRPSL